MRMLGQPVRFFFGYGSFYCHVGNGWRCAEGISSLKHPRIFMDQPDRNRGTTSKTKELAVLFTRYTSFLMDGETLDLSSHGKTDGVLQNKASSPNSK